MCVSFSLCPGDLEQCCIPKLIPEVPKLDPEIPNEISNPSSKANLYKPSCGQRNTNGIDIRVIDPIDGKKATQFGEWPHVCVLYKNNEFVGGASIVAPGVVVTAAHKVE